MMREGRTLRLRRAAWVGLIVPLTCWASVVLGGTPVPTAVGAAPVAYAPLSATSAGGCQRDADCDDNDPCTQDACIDADCIRTPIPDCVSCTPTLVCPSIDVAFLMDTSGSMGDEAAALCNQIGQIIADLQARGVAINPRVLGLTETPGGSFSCLTDNVASLVCGTGVCDTPACPFPGDVSSFESWGPATAVAAGGLNWTPGATRIIVPIGDEGPCNGSRPNGCKDPGDDADSIQEAIAAAVANGVIVSPIVGTGADGCVRALAVDLAVGTGGKAFFTQDAGAQLAGAVVDLILSQCAPDDRCDDGNFCTRDDTCVSGRCMGTPIAGCQPCTPSGFCSDGNACTTDVCVNSECITTPNFDDSAFCCQPVTGALAPLSDGEPCTADVCDVKTGVVTHPVLKDGIPCDDGAFCSVGELCMTGVCGGGDARDCGFLDDACNRGVCNESVDVCEAQPANESGPCDDGDVCVVGETCTSGVCGGGGDVVCPDNQDLCTDLTCDPNGAEGNCDLTAAVNDGGVCDDGDACLIGESCIAGLCGGGVPAACPDNGEACTDAVCDPLGIEGNCDATINVDVGAACDDGDACTATDVCDGAGGCGGVDINTLPCSTDDDCFGSVCDSGTGRCFCTLTPTLTLKPVPGNLANSCYLTNETITVDVVLGLGALQTVGGQFLVGYDPDVLRFLSVSQGNVVDPTSPFSLGLLTVVDELAGTVCYGVGVPFGGTGTRGPATMASLQFETLRSCTTVELTFLDAGTCGTKLASNTGQAMAFKAVDSGIITIAGDAPTLACPPDTVANADPGEVTTDVVWPEIVATGGCGGPVQLNCMATHSAGLNIDALIARGGRFPSGLAEFHCDAVDMCGQTSSCAWSVQVDPTNCVRARAELSPPIVAGPITRCIEFTFFENCVESPITVRRVMEFGGPFNLSGKAGPVEFDVPQGLFMCVTARDPLHTLRATTIPTIENGCYVVDFRGDPFFGGNWLIGGNLNGDGVIDALDLDSFLAAGSQPVAPNTSCDTVGPHADVNGDGLVDTLDSAFISSNLFARDGDSCCRGTLDDSGIAAAVEVLVRDLDAYGLSELRAADLNGDGVLDAADIAAYYDGTRPATRRKVTRGARR